jgi:UDP:flavonoid glycosyltransferase YjiC (YdhE family)
MTRITLIASGTRGDVQPAVALGRGLRAAGYAVRVVAGATFGGWIEEHGLEAARSSVDMVALMGSPAGRAWVENGHRPIRQQRFMRELIDAHGDGLIRDAADASEDADLVLSGFTSDAYALAIGERHGIPVVSLPLQPAMIATRDGRAMAAAPFPGRVSRVNAWFGRLVLEGLAWRLYGDAVNRFRRSVGLRPQSGREHAAERRRMPTLHGVSRHVMPLPADWPATCHVTGYWFLDEAPGREPPGSLTAFLAAAAADGAPVVSVGFGSMTGADAGATAALVLQAVRVAGVRAVLLSGWGGLGAGRVPAGCLVVEEAPHGWLFGRVAAAVHHGGAGTTAAAFRAGVPQVVVPHMADQPYWGRRVRELGTGPAPLPRHRLTPEALGTAIRAVVGDGATRDRAARLAGAVRAEDGVGEAVRLIRGIVPP